MNKKVFVSGCFDRMHSGHIAFFEEASTHGDLYVGIGSDKTIEDLKGKKTIFSEDERLYMIKSLKFVTDAWISQGTGILDFSNEIVKLKPDIFFVNEDGHTPEKEKFCKSHGIDYIISKRIPRAGLPIRSTTTLRDQSNIPYRIDLAGGWLDQPFVSKFHPGPVLTISIEPDYEFNDRSGMATSTRKKAIELWNYELPQNSDKVQLAKILFSYENPPGSAYISGSQDSIGIALPGLNYLWYDENEYWPSRIDSIYDDKILTWLEQRIFLMPIKPRDHNFYVLDKTNISFEGAKDLAHAADDMWKGISEMDPEKTGSNMTKSFQAQTAMFPMMRTSSVEEVLKKIPSSVLGYKLSGAGGGGYLVLFSDFPQEHFMKVKIRRK